MDRRARQTLRVRLLLMPLRVTIQTEMDMTNTLHHAMVSFAAMVFQHVAVALGSLVASPATIGR